MESLSLNWVAETMGARIVGAADGEIASVSTDSRQIEPNALFFALLGENSDGHEYVAQAFAKGAIAAVVSRELPDASGPLLVVPDTLFALGELAKAYRSRFDLHVVGITGSVGKTSTKEMLAAILRTKYTVLANERNFNNEIGVPLTLFQLTRAHQVAVIEMGMRGPGEIDRLAEIAQPNIALITNIGFAHIERLGSQQNIASAKAELLRRLPENGIAILPRYDAYFDYLSQQVPANAVTVGYGEERDDPNPPYVRVRPVAAHPEGGPEGVVTMGKKSAFFALKVRGAHHLHNAGGALAVAAVLDVPLPQAVAALEAWEGAPGRMVVRETPDGMTVLDDCYNAGPDSMASALATLSQTTVVQGVAVLGDMRELGDFGPEAHRFVGRKVIEAQVRLLVTVGALAEEIAAEAARTAEATGKPMPPVVKFATTKEAAANIRALVTPKDTVLVKGSRAMEMEQVVAVLTGQPKADAHG